MPVLFLEAPRTALWVTTLAAAGKLATQIRGLILAASPAILALLTQRGVRAELWPWGIPDGELSQEFAAGDECTLVADLPDATARNYGVDQPTHRRWWDAAFVAARRAWERGGSLSADELCGAAQRASQVELRDAGLRKRLEQLVRRVVVPRVVVEQIAAALQQCGAPWYVVGHGWEDWDGPTPARVVRDAHAEDALPNDERPRLAIFVTPEDALHPLLPRCAARGGSVAVWGGAGADLAGVLREGDDFTPFDDARAWQALLTEATRGSCTTGQPRARLAAHADTRRLATLQQRLFGSPT